jgi:tryptophan synthase alpha chain
LTTIDRPDRIADLFARTRAEGRPALIPFVPAGWPEADATPAIVEAAIAGGADALELGLPFSDPLADGATNQQAYHEALEQGVTPATVLENVRDLRSRGVEIPLIIMGYLNPMLAYGGAAFVCDAVTAGVDGLIVVDMPPSEAREIEEPARAAGLHIIYLVAPTSTDERLRVVAEHAGGFVYCVSLAGVTGARTEMSSDLGEFLARVRGATDLPLAVGFGISERKHVEQVGAVADGAVVGSAFVNVVAAAPRAERAAAVRAFVEQMSGRASATVAAGS